MWDWVRVGGRAPVVLDLGCGEVKQDPEHVGVDVRVTKAVDVVADVSAGVNGQVRVAAGGQVEVPGLRKLTISW
nr:MAG: hypothetical protein DIU80_23365 [Chloroflexota bacterium]